MTTTEILSPGALSRAAQGYLKQMGSQLQPETVAAAIAQTRHAECATIVRQIQTGVMLLALKAATPHGQWMRRMEELGKLAEAKFTARCEFEEKAARTREELGKLAEAKNRAVLGFWDKSKDSALSFCDEDEQTKFATRCEFGEKPQVKKVTVLPFCQNSYESLKLYMHLARAYLSDREMQARAALPAAEGKALPPLDMEAAFQLALSPEGEGSLAAWAAGRSLRQILRDLSKAQKQADMEEAEKALKQRREAYKAREAEESFLAAQGEGSVQLEFREFFSKTITDVREKICSPESTLLRPADWRRLAENLMDIARDILRDKCGEQKS